MRKGISLIELIFTIVIIAVVFTVIPKIVLALSKSDEFAIKQDALFNGMTMTQMISKLSWDENSANSNDILSTTHGNVQFACNATTYYYRLGGFRGSRNCIDSNGTLSASLIGLDVNDTVIYNAFNDIDDFNAQPIIDANTSDGKKYGLHVEVKYISDTIDYSIPQRAIVVLNKTGVTPTTNLKLVDVNVTYQGKRGTSYTPITQFSYVSTNIGKFFLAKRTW